MRFSLLLCFLPLSLLGAEPAALSASEETALLAQAQAVSDAFKTGDADLILKSTHPAIEKFFPSREAYEATVRESVKQLNSVAKIESWEFGKPSPVYAAGAEEVCFVPNKSVMTIGDKRARSIGFLIAARPKGAAKWLFLDAAPLRKQPDVLGKLFPELPKDVPLPPNKVELIP